MAERIPAAIDAGALAVPHAEYAVVLALTPELGLLRAPQRGGGEILVEAGHELDVVFLQGRPGAQHGCLERCDRRSAIAGDVAGRVEAGLSVTRALGQHQADN